MANKPRGKPFEPGNPGKPVGAVAKTPKLVKDWFAETFQYLQTDPEAIEKKADLKSWSLENKTEFYKLSSKLLPIQIAGDPENPLTINPTEGMTFEQLYQLKYGTKP